MKNSRITAALVCLFLMSGCSTVGNLDDGKLEEVMRYLAYSAPQTKKQAVTSSAGGSLTAMAGLKFGVRVTFTNLWLDTVTFKDQGLAILRADKIQYSGYFVNWDREPFAFPIRIKAEID